MNQADLIGRWFLVNANPNVHSILVFYTIACHWLEVTNIIPENVVDINQYRFENNPLLGGTYNIENIQNESRINIMDQVLYNARIVNDKLSFIWNNRNYVFQRINENR